jgi:hypothetical protein
VLNGSRADGVPVVVRVEKVDVGLEGMAVVAVVAVAVVVVVAVAVGEIFAAGVKGTVRVFEVETKADIITFQEEASRSEIGRVFFEEKNDNEIQRERKEGREGSEEGKRRIKLVRCISISSRN